MSSLRWDYIPFVLRRVSRLWPLVLVACAVCMAVGYFIMLPDDYQNVAQSAVAANSFLHNHLSYITTHNYWAPANGYRPLMHTWFIGVLVQIYCAVPLLFVLISRFVRNKRRAFLIFVIATSVLSLFLFLSPRFSADEKFYHMQFRWWEFGVGALTCMGIGYMKRTAKCRKSLVWLGRLALLAAIMLLAVPSADFSNQVLTIAAVAIAAILLMYPAGQDRLLSGVLANPYVAYIGQINRNAATASRSHIFSLLTPTICLTDKKWRKPTTSFIPHWGMPSPTMRLNRHATT